MLHAQQRGEEEAACQESRISARQNDRQNQDAVEESIVLKVNVVDDQ